MEEVQDLAEMFKDFLISFNKDGSYKYQEAIKRMILAGQRSLTIDFEDLLTYNMRLASSVAEAPEETLQNADIALMEVIKIFRRDYLEKVRKLHVRIRAAGDHIPIRRISSSEIGRMIHFTGIVTKASTVRQQIVEATYECQYCGNEITSTAHITTCPKCEKKQLMLDLKRSTFEDVQFLVVQEETEALSSGRMPKSIDVVLKDDLVDAVKPGDRVLVSGIVGIKKDKSLYKLYVEANHIESLTKGTEEIEISQRDEEVIRKVAKDPDLISKLIASVAPSIYGMDEVKEAILYMLVGGVTKVTPDGIRLRGDINILLVGDPGTAKSQLLKYVATIAPKAVYTSGRGSTAAGLTVAVVKNEIGEPYLEAGALVLADGGVCCIDEIDKMKSEDRVAMHEAMEQQTVSIAKAGIVATLNARCSILAAANPALGRYMHNRPITENIKLPPTLLSRFDLIFIISDVPNKDRDEALSRHVIDVRAEKYKAPYFSPEFIRKYIAYARRLRPSLSDEACRKISEYYLRLRGAMTPDSPIAITPRQLESLIRLAEARAKLFLRDKVTAEDAEAAIRLMDYCLRTVAKDEMGRIDIDIIMSGKPKTKREKMLKIIEIVERLEKELAGQPVHKDLIIEEAEKYGIDKAFTEDALEKLCTQGVLFKPKSDYYKKIR